eukprot:SAG31_NODE_95_length_25901_cov_24.763700_15_plen_112_part_00
MLLHTDVACMLLQSWVIVHHCLETGGTQVSVCWVDLFHAFTTRKFAGYVARASLSDHFVKMSLRMIASTVYDGIDKYVQQQSHVGRELLPCCSLLVNCRRGHCRRGWLAKI